MSKNQLFINNVKEMFSTETNAVPRSEAEFSDAASQLLAFIAEDHQKEGPLDTLDLSQGDLALASLDEEPSAEKSFLLCLTPNQNNPHERAYLLRVDKYGDLYKLIGFNQFRTEKMPKEAWTDILKSLSAFTDKPYKLALTIETSDVQSTF